MKILQSRNPKLLTSKQKSKQILCSTLKKLMTAINSPYNFTILKEDKAVP
jgi:hypothetical protein